MKCKKYLALALATVMTISAFTGCGKGEGGKDKTSMSDVTFPLEETMSFTGFAVMNGTNELTDNPAWQYALERANIEIDLTSVLASELTERQGLLLASGQYPELLFKTNVDTTRYGSEGILLPLEDLIRKYAPNLTKALDETDGWKDITEADGHVYSLPSQADHKVEGNPFWINTKWLKNLGLSMPTSYDELYNVLKAFKTQDANGNGDPSDEIPMLLDTGLSIRDLMIYQDYKVDRPSHMAVIDGELEYTYTHESFKDFLVYAKKLYDEGLLDERSFTIARDQLTAIGSSEDVLGSFMVGGSFQAVGRDNDDDYEIVLPFSENTMNPNAEWIKGAMAITDACENPEVLVAWADYFYSEEGGTLAWMGIEGETYEVNDDGTWSWITDGTDVDTLRSTSTIQGVKYHPSIIPDIWYQLSADTDAEEVYLNEQRNKYLEHASKERIRFVYTEDEQDAISTIKSDLGGYITQFTAEVVTGRTPLNDDTWDAYLSRLNMMGLEEYVEIVTEAYARSIEE